MSFVLFETEAYSSNLSSQAVAVEGAAAIKTKSLLAAQEAGTGTTILDAREAGVSNVIGPVIRRPTRGGVPKGETHAYFTVLDAQGNPILLLNNLGSTRRTKTSQVVPRDTGFEIKDRYYTDFVLQRVVRQRVEKYQIVQTFGEPFVFFFGESPAVLQVEAVLINYADFNFRAEWQANYDRYLRGTKLAEMGARAYLAWDDQIVEGYPTGFQTVDDAMNPYQIPLAFSFYVTAEMNLGQLSFDLMQRLMTGFADWRTEAEFIGENAISTDTVDLTARDRALLWYMLVADLIAFANLTPEERAGVMKELVGISSPEQAATFEGVAGIISSKVGTAALTTLLDKLYEKTSATKEPSGALAFANVPKVIFGEEGERQFSKRPEEGHKQVTASSILKEVLKKGPTLTGQNVFQKVFGGPFGMSSVPKAKVL